MIEHRLSEFFQFFDAKADVQRRAGTKIRPLFFRDRVYALLCVSHLHAPFSSFCLRFKNRSSILCCDLRYRLLTGGSRFIKNRLGR